MLGATMFPRTCSTRDQRPITIREAVGDDAPALLAFLEVVASDTDFVSFQPGEFSMTEEQEREFLEQSRTTRNRLSFDGGKYNRNQHTGFFGVSVRREFWSLGIGSALLDGLVDWARAGSVVRKIDLFVRTDNRRAIDLYERKGFLHEGTRRMDLIVDGRAYDSHLMGLVL